MPFPHLDAMPDRAAAAFSNDNQAPGHRPHHDIEARPTAQPITVQAITLDGQPPL